MRVLRQGNILKPDKRATARIVRVYNWKMRQCRRCSHQAPSHYQLRYAWWRDDRWASNGQRAHRFRAAGVV